MASGNMKDIKRRIKSVQSTMQITKAMELVASSKMRRAKERALSVRPYFNAMYETVARLASVTRDSDSVYTRRREVKNSLYIIIAGDRGLAGGYNSNVFKLAAAEMEGRNASVITIGKKAQEHYAKRQWPVAADYPGVAETMRISDTHEIVGSLVEAFCSGRADEVFLCYTEFVSPLQQEAKCIQLLPVSFERKENADKGGAHVLTEYDPSPEAVFKRSDPRISVRRAVRRGSRKLLLRAVCAPHGNGGCVRQRGRDDRKSEPVLQPCTSGSDHAGDHGDRRRLG